MEKSIVLQFLILLAVTILPEINGKCVKHPVIETDYSCVGGNISDLNSIPSNAEMIRISNMNVTRFAADTLKRFKSSLAVFTCSHCNIREIDIGAFQSLEYLEQIVLDNNHLTSVKSEWFSRDNYLTYVDLSYNEIEEIDSDVYARLPYLVELRLSGNRIECLNTEALSALRSLKHILIVEMPEFKCPQIVSKFLEKNNISATTDGTWKNSNISPDVEAAYHSKVQSSVVKIPEPVVTTQSPPKTRAPEFPTAVQETLAPIMTVEDIDIPSVLTTNSLPKVPESSSPKPIVPPAATSQPEPPLEVTEPPEISMPKNPNNLLVSLVASTVATELEVTGPPVIVIPTEVNVIHHTPEPTKQPIFMPPAPPTGGEPPISVSEVQPLNQNATNHEPYNPPGQYQEQIAEGSTVAAIIGAETDKPLPPCYNFGTPSQLINKYLLAIIVAGLCWLHL